MGQRLGEVNTHHSDADSACRFAAGTGPAAECLPGWLHRFLSVVEQHADQAAAASIAAAAAAAAAD